MNFTLSLSMWLNSTGCSSFKVFLLASGKPSSISLFFSCDLCCPFTVLLSFIILRTTRTHLGTVLCIFNRVIVLISVDIAGRRTVKRKRHLSRAGWQTSSYERDDSWWAWWDKDCQVIDWLITNNKWTNWLVYWWINLWKWILVIHKILNTVQRQI